MIQNNTIQSLIVQSQWSNTPIWSQEEEVKLQENLRNISQRNI